jgi:hypothetical protein
MPAAHLLRRYERIRPTSNSMTGAASAQSVRASRLAQAPRSPASKPSGIASSILRKLANQMASNVLFIDWDAPSGQVTRGWDQNRKPLRAALICSSDPKQLLSNYTQRGQRFRRNRPCDLEVIVRLQFHKTRSHLRVHRAVQLPRVVAVRQHCELDLEDDLLEPVRVPRKRL